MGVELVGDVPGVSLMSAGDDDVNLVWRRVSERPDVEDADKALHDENKSGKNDCVTEVRAFLR